MSGWIFKHIVQYINRQLDLQLLKNYKYQVNSPVRENIIKSVEIFNMKTSSEEYLSISA